MTHNCPPTSAPSPSWTACCVCQQQLEEKGMWSRHQQLVQNVTFAQNYANLMCVLVSQSNVQPVLCLWCAMCVPPSMWVCVRVCAHHMPSTKQTVGQQQVQGKHNQQLERERSGEIVKANKHKMQLKVAQQFFIASSFFYFYGTFHLKVAHSFLGD